MDEKEPAWKAELMSLLDEHFISSSEEIFDLVAPHIQAAEERGRREATQWTAERLGAFDAEVLAAFKEADPVFAHFSRAPESP